MGPGGADFAKSQKYSPMIVGLRSSRAANVLDILVLMYKIFVK